MVGFDCADELDRYLLKARPAQTADAAESVLPLSSEIAIRKKTSEIVQETADGAVTFAPSGKWRAASPLFI